MLATCSTFLPQSGGVGLDKHGGKVHRREEDEVALGADDEGCTVGDIDNRRSHDTGELLCR